MRGHQRRDKPENLQSGNQQLSPINKGGLAESEARPIYHPRPTRNGVSRWKIALALVGSILSPVAVFALSQYLTARGLVSITLARILLGIAWLCISGLIVLVVKAFEIKKPILTIAAGILLVAVTFGGLETWASLRKARTVVSPNAGISSTQGKNSTAVSPLVPSATERQTPSQPKASINPKSETPAKAHPVIVVTGTQVSNNTDTRHIEIVITLANHGSTEVNTHIVFQTFIVFADGSERSTGPPDERDIGFPPLPFLYQLTYSFDTTAEGEMNYANGSFVNCVVDVSYPDKGGEAIYHFRGKTNPKIDHLDYTRSEWEYLPHS